MSYNTDMLHKHFSAELNSIKKPEIVDLVVSATDKLCGEYFWTRPAARNNAYHPQVSCGEGGLVRHVKYACWCGEEAMRAFDTRNNGQGTKTSEPTDNHDVVIAALILHDMMKEGDPAKANGPKRDITGCHGIDMAENIVSKILGGNITTPDQSMIVHGVACHMGVWTSDPAYIPHNLSDPEIRHVALLVHMGDYFASRKADTYMTSLLENYQG